MRSTVSLESDEADIRRLKVQLADMHQAARTSPRPMPPPLVEVLAPLAIDGSVRQHRAPRQQVHRDAHAVELSAAPLPVRLLAQDPALLVPKMAPEKTIRSRWAKALARSSATASGLTMLGLFALGATPAPVSLHMTAGAAAGTTGRVVTTVSYAAPAKPFPAKPFPAKPFRERLGEPRAMLDTSERPAMMESAVITLGDPPPTQSPLTLDRALGMPGMLLPTAARPGQPEARQPNGAKIDRVRATADPAASQPTRKVAAQAAPTPAKRGASVPMAAVGSSDSLASAQALPRSNSPAQPATVVPPVARRAPPVITNDAGIAEARQRQRRPAGEPIARSAQPTGFREQ